jgi:simple sugar transport system permease protein
MTLKKLLKRNEFYIFVLVLLFSAGVTAISPVFLSVENIFSLIKTSSGSAVLAVGILIVLVSGGFDVSSTAIAICAQYITVNIAIACGIQDISVAFLIAMVVGLALGSINAIFIAFFRLPTLIVTLGTASLFHGALLEFVGTKAINLGELPQCFKTFGAAFIFSVPSKDGNPVGLSVSFAVLVAVLILSWFILRHTMVGRGVYAIGGDIEAARNSGFNVKRIQFFLYCYVGVLAGIAGILHLCLIRYSNPNYLVGTEMGIIAAVVLGGARITGGTGTLAGSMLGMTLIVILQKNLVLLGLSSYWEQFFIGAVIIVGVSLTYGDIASIFARRRRRPRAITGTKGERG